MRFFYQALEELFSTLYFKDYQTYYLGINSLIEIKIKSL